MKKGILLIFLLGLFCSFTGTTFAAKVVENNTTQSGKTEVNIYFDKNDTKDKIKPTIYEPNIKPTVTTLLPKTGELIQILLFILIGICIIIIEVGFVMFKKVY